MKTKLLVFLGLLALSVNGQGTFQNLDFESATIAPIVGSPYYPYEVEASSALPGWNVYYGTSQQSVISHNDQALGSTWVVLLGTDAFYAPKNIEGNFGVFLQGGLTATDASISQTALVPAFAQSIIFKAQPGSETLLITLAGQNIPFFALSTGPNYNLYGGDISAFSGQTEQLKISALHELRGPNWWNIDSIEFSPNAIPEPKVFGLFGLGSFLFGWCFLKRGT